MTTEKTVNLTRLVSLARSLPFPRDVDADRAAQLELEAACELVGIPVAHKWNSALDPSQKVPGAILEQLRGKRLGAGLRVEYLGDRYLVVSLCGTGLALGERIPNDYEPRWLTLVPSQLVV
jgi:hypothetical protein